MEELQQGLESQEREAVERASQVERQQFLSVARALQPVLEQQAVLACNHLPSSSNLSDLITSLADMAEEQRSSTAELDSMIRLVDNKKTQHAAPPQGPAKCSHRLQLHNSTTFSCHFVARVTAWVYLLHRKRLFSPEAISLLSLSTFASKQANSAKKPLTRIRQGGNNHK